MPHSVPACSRHAEREARGQAAQPEHPPPERVELVDGGEGVAAEGRVGRPVASGAQFHVEVSQLTPAQQRHLAGEGESSVRFVRWGGVGWGCRGG